MKKWHTVMPGRRAGESNKNEGMLNYATGGKEKGKTINERYSLALAIMTNRSLGGFSVGGASQVIVDGNISINCNSLYEC